MRTTRLVAVVAVVALGTLLAACSETKAGSPLPGTSATVASPGASEVTGTGDVPAVENPLDASGYLDDPCKLVKQSDLAALGYTEPGEIQDPDTSESSAFAGPGCSWYSENEEGLSVGIQTGNQDRGIGGLNGARRSFEEGRLAYWEPTKVDDYPAAFTDTQDFRSQGECMIMVGISDDLSFAVNTDGYLDEPQKSCEDVKTVAGMVIETLKDS